RYEEMFRLLKTRFIPITDEAFPLNEDAIDRVENDCLENGIRYKNQWLQKEDRHVQSFQGFTNNKQTDKELKEQEEINSLRRQVANAVGQFDKDIRQAKTVRKKCELYYKL